MYQYDVHIVKPGNLGHPRDCEKLSWILRWSYSSGQFLCKMKAPTSDKSFNEYVFVFHVYVHACIVIINWCISKHSGQLAFSRNPCATRTVQPLYSLWIQYLLSNSILCKPQDVLGDSPEWPRASASPAKTYNGIHMVYGMCPHLAAYAVFFGGVLYLTTLSANKYR